MLRLLAGAAATNQVLWFCPNPYAGSLPHPKCKTKLLTHHIRLIYFFNYFRFVSDKAIIFYYVGAGDTNHILRFYTNPYTGSLPHPNRLSEKHVFIKRHLIPHHKIGSTGQLVSKGLGSNSFVAFGHFLLKKSLGLGNVPFGKVSCFNISPR